jgi:hypothetical protein
MMLPRMCVLWICEEEQIRLRLLGRPSGLDSPVLGAPPLVGLHHFGDGPAIFKKRVTNSQCWNGDVFQVPSNDLVERPARAAFRTGPRIHTCARGAATMNARPLERIVRHQCIAASRNARTYAPVNWSRMSTSRGTADYTADI